MILLNFKLNHIVIIEDFVHLKYATPLIILSYCIMKKYKTK